MKRLKLYVSLVLVVCMLASANLFVVADQVAGNVSWIFNPVAGIKGFIYASTPYGFIVKDWSTENTLTSLINQNGVVVGPTQKGFTYIDEFGYMNCYDSVLDVYGNTIIPEGMYNLVYVLSEDRFVCAQKTESEVAWDEETWGIVDRAGNEIVPFGAYDDFEWYGTVIAYNYDGSAVLIDYDGNVVLDNVDLENICTLPLNDRYLIYDPDLDMTFIRDLEGTDLVEFDGYASFHPYNSIDVEVYEQETNTLIVYVYDLEGNLVDTEVYEDFGGKPYIYRDIYENADKKYFIEVDEDTHEYYIVDKNGNEIYRNGDVDMLNLYKDKYIKIADENWDTMGIVDINGKTIVPLGIYDDVSYSAGCDVFAFEKDNQISIARISDISVKVNGADVAFDQAPIIKDGRTLVPMRAIFEALGATVDWNGETRTVTAGFDGVTVSLTIDSNVMLVNGVAITLDVPAEILNGRTIVPVRAISEAFGCNVDWNGETQTVIITDK